MRGTSLFDVLRANLLRALVIAGVVGTALLMINHGDHLTSEPVCELFYWKAGGMYAVPFTVSLVSSVLASRDRPAPPAAPRRDNLLEPTQHDTTGPNPE